MAYMMLVLDTANKYFEKFFEITLSKLEKKKIIKFLSNSKFKKLRDHFCPKLMSGETKILGRLSVIESICISKVYTFQG